MSLWTNVQLVLLKIPIVGWCIDFFTLMTSAFFFRFASGHWVASNLDKCQRPEKALKLYEFEFCPFCRKVRETLSVLDLDCIIYPCPRETLVKYGVATNESRYRKEAKLIGGKAQFPLLIDENVINNEGKALILYESDDINAYLWKKYGDQANAPPSYKIAQATGILTLALGNLVRCLPQHGLLRIPSRKPKKLSQLHTKQNTQTMLLLYNLIVFFKLNYLQLNIISYQCGLNL